MTINRDNPATWPYFLPQICGHDVGRSRDRSTVVRGGLSPFEPRLIGIEELTELPQGLFGSARAEAVAQIDRANHKTSLVVTDFSYDPTYAEPLFEVLGPRLIGLQISRSGDGREAEWRPVKGGGIPVYTVGRSYLLETLHRQLIDTKVRFVDGPESRRAYQQLMSLETVLSESGTQYKCPSGQHDDLGMACAMLIWFAMHQHLPWYLRKLHQANVVRKPRPAPSARGWT